VADLLAYVIRKMFLAIPIVITATIVVFLLLYLTPGDPIKSIVPPRAGPEVIEQVREQYGLNEPIYVQYGMFVWRALHGDLGNSITVWSGTSVSKLVWMKLPNTLMLMGLGLTISYSIAVPLGVISALRQNSWIDRSGMVFTLIAYAMPPFWLGVLFLMIFSLYLGWFPVEGTTGGIKGLILPALTLGIGNAALTTRMMRSSMLEVIRQDYITQLKSRGLPKREVIFKHALKNALLPVITVLGLDIGWFVGGSVVVEEVFSWPGIGQLMTSAIYNHDFPLVQGTILVLVIAVIFGNLLADVLYAWADPRVRLG
jgi:ABC-type dipeptide/oligopeptide/nickel transport system permease component